VVAAVTDSVVVKHATDTGRTSELISQLTSVSRPLDVDRAARHGGGGGGTEDTVIDGRAVIRRCHRLQSFIRCMPVTVRSSPLNGAVSSSHDKRSSHPTYFDPPRRANHHHHHHHGNHHGNF